MPSEAASRRAFWIILLACGGLMLIGLLWAFFSAAPALSAIPQHTGDVRREACLACHARGINGPMMPHRDWGHCAFCHGTR